MPPRFLLVPILLAAGALAVPAQNPAPPLEEQTTPPPATVEEALTLDAGDVNEYWEGRPTEELEEYLAAWMEFVRERQEESLIAFGAEEGSSRREEATQLASERDKLISVAETLIATLAEAGGNVARWRTDIADIREADKAALARQSTAPTDQTSARRLPVEVLRAQLRPMRKEQVEEQLEKWLDLLQKKCIEVSKVEIASLQSEDGEDINKLTGRSVTLWTEREQLIQRVTVVVEAFESKGGDATEARAYLKSVVRKPGVTVRTAYTALLSWFTNPDGGIALFRKLWGSVLILALAWVASRLAGRLVDRGLKRMRRFSKLLRSFLAGSMRNTILAIGALFALSRLGFDMGPLMAAIGAMGLVIGLALQDTLGNFASGIMIMIYRPFDVSDVVTAGGVTGRVNGMTLVTTKIKTFDNQVIYIPNNMLWNDIITNVTSSKTRRIDMVFGISYQDDVRKAKDVLERVVAAEERVLADPEPVIQVHELGDSSVNFVVRPWVATENYWPVYWSLTQTVKERFDTEGISIPFPQRDVHLYPAAPPEPSPGAQAVPAERPDAPRDTVRS